MVDWCLLSALFSFELSHLIFLGTFISKKCQCKDLEETENVIKLE